MCKQAAKEPRLSPVLAVLLVQVIGRSGVQAFGKYLQAHQSQHLAKNSVVHKEESANEKGDAVDEVDVKNEVDALQHQGNSRTESMEELEIEVIAAILMATIFAIFILIYLVMLQCWWWFSELKKSRSVAHVVSDSQCSCFAQTAWEPVDADLEKYLSNPDSIKNCS